LAFLYCDLLDQITIPAGVSFIDYGAFGECGAMTNITVDAANPAHSSVDGVLFNKDQTNLLQCPEGKLGNHYVVPDSVTTIGIGAFYTLSNVKSITIPASVTSIQQWAFFNWDDLRRIYFLGDAPSLGDNVFDYSSATLYYLPGAAGWSSAFEAPPAVLWNPRILTDDGLFGINAGQFGFTFMGAANVPVAIDASSDLGNRSWTTVTNLTCGADGTVQFTDPDAGDQPVRTYRFRPE
jgi:hypothetical protein